MSKNSITLTLASETHSFIAVIAQQNDVTVNEVARYLLTKGLAHHADQLLAHETQKHDPYKRATQKGYIRQAER